jgi:hypothetical protein
MYVIVPGIFSYKFRYNISAVYFYMYRKYASRFHPPPWEGVGARSADIIWGEIKDREDQK